MALGQASQLMAFKHTFEAREAAEPAAGVPEPPLEGVAEAAETPDDEGQQERQSDFYPVERHLGTTIALGYVSAVAVLAEYSGKNQFLPEPGEAIATSMAHPVLGYVGAWAVSMATRNESRLSQLTAIFTAATAANFITEKAQSVIVASPQFVDFMSQRNLPETGKDYLFALGGAVFFAWQNRRASS